MKKSLLACVILLLSVNLSVFAQDNSPQQKIQNIRKNVYSRVLALTPEEGNKFWPVFDEMQARLNEIKKQMKEERMNISKNYATLSDAQMEKAVDHLFSLEQQALDIRKKYYQKFKKVLPIKKVALLPRAEREFKKRLLEIIKGYKDNDD